MKNALPVLIVTGLSGAGKSTALNVLEDLRFYCVDGLPASLLPKMVDLFGGDTSRRHRGLALGIDARNIDISEEWREAREYLDSFSIKPQVIFLEARSSELMRRYAETRRLHPLETKSRGLEQALELETELLSQVRDQADVVIDTSDFSIHDLRRTLQEKWKNFSKGHFGLRVHLVSFGFKYGVPLETDLVFDLRFLPNPHFDKALKPLSGKQKKIAAYVLDNEMGTEFLTRFTDFLAYLLPLYLREGRYRLTIGLGCTGGRHRSVAVTEAVYKALRARGYETFLEHRHLDLG
ncbi:MAG: RNase adapter RapZ [Desulfovibrionales bacterium]